MEVIEHLDLERLPALEYNVFAGARPAAVVVTAPNAEYNVRYGALAACSHRHLPWSLKADTLLREQYTSVGAAARTALPAAVDSLTLAAGRGLDVGELLQRTTFRSENADAFTAAYRRYCWRVDGLTGVQVASFQLLAGEGVCWRDRDYLWHLDLAEEASVAAGVGWWQDLTDAGGEGMVVKPLANLVRTRRRLAQAPPRRDPAGNS